MSYIRKRHHIFKWTSCRLYQTIAATTFKTTSYLFYDAQNDNSTPKSPIKWFIAKLNIYKWLEKITGQVKKGHVKYKRCIIYLNE